MARKDNDEVNDQHWDRDFTQPSETTLESAVGFNTAAESNHESKPPSYMKYTCLGPDL